MNPPRGSANQLCRTIWFFRNRFRALTRRTFLSIFLVPAVLFASIGVYVLCQYDPPIVEWEEEGPMTVFSQRHRNLTIVSAYFNLGTFPKGTLLCRLFKRPYSNALYRKWASVFSRIQNPVIFYTDSLDFKGLMESARKDLHSLTEIVYISNRSSLSSFSLIDRIKEIYDDPKYPKYYPDTVRADYPCVQNAKYELVADAIKRKSFSAEYYAWLDVGYFRDIVDDMDRFVLQVPSDFDDNKVAMNRVEDQPMQRTPAEVIKNGIVWVGGGLFLGRPQTLLLFSEDYKQAVLTLLSQKLMNSDQQILYAMYTEKGQQEIQPRVQLQLYYPTDKGNIFPEQNPWFHLGYVCLKRLRPKRNNNNSLDFA